MQSVNLFVGAWEEHINDADVFCAREAPICTPRDTLAVPCLVCLVHSITPRQDDQIYHRPSGQRDCADDGSRHAVAECTDHSNLVKVFKRAAISKFTVLLKIMLDLKKDEAKME